MASNGATDELYQRHPISKRRVFERIGAASAVSISGLVESSSVLTRSHGVTKTDTKVTSLDGTTIELSLFEPPSEGPHPAVITIQGGTARRGSREDRARALATDGYLAVTYDPRGIARSGGIWNIGGRKDCADISALIDFLRDGNPDVDPPVQTERGEPVVGLEGGSGGGWRAVRAASRDDRIDAVQAVITPHDAAAAFNDEHILQWPWAVFLESAITLPWVTTPDDPDLDTLTAESFDTGEQPEELVDWFEQRSPKTGIGNVEAPVQVLNGWHERLFPAREAFDLYRGLSNAPERRLVVVDFVAHDAEWSPSPTPTELEFFGRSRSDWLAKHLKDEELPAGSPVVGDPIAFYDAQSDRFDSSESLPTGSESVSSEMVLRRSGTMGTE